MREYNMRVSLWFSDNGVELSVKAENEEQAMKEAKEYISDPDFYAREEVNTNTLSIISSREVF